MKFVKELVTAGTHIPAAALYLSRSESPKPLRYRAAAGTRSGWSCTRWTGRRYCCGAA